MDQENGSNGSDYGYKLNTLSPRENSRIPFKRKPLKLNDVLSSTSMESTKSKKRQYHLTVRPLLEHCVQIEYSMVLSGEQKRIRLSFAAYL